MRTPGTVCRLLVGAAALVFACNAGAQTVRYELDGEAPLTSAAWTFIQAEATSSFSAGLLRLQTSRGYAEWMLRAAADKPAATSGWLADAKPGRGWWVEARVQIATATNCILGGPGMWIDDGKSFVQLHFDTAEAKGPRMAKSVALGADPSRLASLLLSYIPQVCAFVAPRHPGASAPIID